MTSKRALSIVLCASLTVVLGCGDDTGAGGTGGSGGAGGTGGTGGARDGGADAPRDAPMIDAPIPDAPVDAPEPDASPDAGPMCPTPIRALATTDSYDGTLMGMSLNDSTSCQSSTQGPEDVFTLHLDAQTALVFSTAGSRTMVDTVLEIRRVCEDPSSAVACDDDSGPGTTSVLPVVLEAGDYFVLVDTYSSSPTTTGGDYNLAVSPLQFGYSETSVPSSCDDLTTGTVLTLTPAAGTSIDDAASAITALPFNFQLAGTTVTHYSVTSNGFAQLWTSATGMPSRAFRNNRIPVPDAPNGFLAPFWDDLSPVTGGNTDARVASFGTAPNRHFTIQWTNWTLFDDDTTRLTFQAKLFETSHVVEFHYCTLTPGTVTPDLATGGSATVGIEDLTGTVGRAHSFNTAGSVSTSSALRFTPL